MVETINHYASLWLDWQWSMLWQTAVLVAVVAVVDRLTRKWAWPQLRYALWLLVLVKLVLPPTLTSPVSITSTVPTLAQRAMVAPAEMPTAIDSPGQEEMAPAIPVVPADVPSDSLSVPAASESQSASTNPPTVPAPALSWRAYAMGAWLLGVVILGVGLAIYLRRLVTEHAEERPDEVPDWFDEILSQVVAEVRLRRIPRIVFSSRVCCPAVFGLFRPVILFPVEHLTTLTRGEARHVLLHELAHIKRGDLLVHAVHMGLVILYWFNPLLWLMRKHMQNLRELCCDATVARILGSESGAYRQTLLATGRALLARPIDPGLGLLGLHENPGWLAVRLDWLQRNTCRRPWLRRISVTLVIALMLCCVLPMASLQADVATEDGCKVTLSNGAVIELVGLYNEKAGRWWRPNGMLLDEGPYDPNVEADCTEIALRYKNLPSGTFSNYGIDRGQGPWLVSMGCISVPTDGRLVENIARGQMRPEDGAETTALRVQLATGDWQTYADASPRGSWIMSSAGAVTFFKPHERNGQTWWPIAHILGDCDTRVIAIDVNNVEHEFRGSGWVASGSQRFFNLTARFDLPLDDIATIRFQKRPYTQIEFRNVSLIPGQSQKVEIVTTGPEQEPDPAIVRELSSREMKLFHSGIMRSLKASGIESMAKERWPKKFKLYEASRVKYAQLLSSVDYFGPDGFQSLGPQHFLSPTASKTPIMYHKWLLELEEGKGTNVLFGDGRVEYVTARELDRLKAAGMPD